MTHAPLAIERFRAHEGYLDLFEKDSDEPYVRIPLWMLDQIILAYIGVKVNHE